MASAVLASWASRNARFRRLIQRRGGRSPFPRNGKTVEGIVDAYLDSQDFATKRDRTRDDYRKLARKIVAEFGDMPIAALADKRVRGDIP